MSKVFSGIQPTGLLHLGNYLGSIKNWLNHQDDAFFCVVDLHSITVHQDPKVLKQDVLTTVAHYLASEIDPSSANIFCQSTVKEHSELAWILGCNTMLGWLNRMTQFKDKAGKSKDKASLGLYSYPVLMAADILLYDAEIVPVGEDQKQHIELTRDIALSFNRKFEQEIFVVPEPLILNTRIMSLKDGSNKMSKSAISDYSRINLTDSNDLIAQKVRKAKTDSITAIYFDPENRPEIANLLNIYAIINDNTIEQVVNSFANQNMTVFKSELTELLISVLAPIRNKATELMQDPQYLEHILSTGKEKASEIASSKICKVKQVLGLRN